MRKTLNLRATYLVAAMGVIGVLGASGTKAAVIYDSNNWDGVSNNPPILPVMVVAAPVKVTRIVNYHWNFGSGGDPTGNSISIADLGAGGALVGSWPTTWDGNGRVNTYWQVFPDVVLGPGSYQIVDSGRETWSYANTNFFNGAGPNWEPGIGMTQVFGEVIVPEPASGLVLATLACALSGRRRR
jgi:hypothetical protein